MSAATHRSDDPLRIGVLLSGSGTTLQNLIDRAQSGSLPIRVECVVSNRPGVRGLDRAVEHGIPAFVAATDDETFALLRQHRVELVCLAGYLRKLNIPPDFEQRILNIHPSLLPAFGGAGYYGDRVHRAVLAAGAAESGATVHWVDEEYDRGPILDTERVPVRADDTVEVLRDRVQAAERRLYPRVLQRLHEAIRRPDSSTDRRPSARPTDSPTEP